MTIFQTLQALSAYPIPNLTIRNSAESCGLIVESEITEEIRKSANYKKSVALIYKFLSEAPNISQGGISYSFTSTEKQMFRSKANEMLLEADNSYEAEYGWQGEDF